MPKNYQIIEKNYEEGAWVCDESLVGREITCEFAMTENDVNMFADLSGDHSPMHMSGSAAQKMGFKGRVAHGVIQLSFVSAIVGMEFPGENGVLQQADIKYRKPCYPGDKLKIRMRVQEVHPSVQTIINKIEIKNQSGEVISRGKVQSGII